jgi:hypothetical protein
VYQRHLTEELTDGTVDCVVDATGGAFFGQFDADSAMSKQMPELWDALSADHPGMTFYLDVPSLGRVPFQVLVPK